LRKSSGRGGKSIADSEGAPENAALRENVALRENLGLVEKPGLRERLEKPVRRAHEGKSEHAGQPGPRDQR